MSVWAIEAEVSIKSGVRAECMIGREVIVEVHEDVTLESLTVTANGNYTPAEGVDGFSDVTVNVPERIPVTESLSVTANGTYEPTEGIDGYDRVMVNVPPTIPEIEALTVTEDGVYTSSGDGYNPVTVNTGVASLRQEIQSAETASGCSPLVDGLTALTTYANEVTGQEDETLSDAVETLVNKYGKAEFNPFKCAYSMQDAFRGAVLPEVIAIDFEGNSSLTSVNNAFRGASGVKHLVFKNLQSNRVTMTYMLFQCTSIETLEFIDCAFGVKTFDTFATGAGNLQEIIGELDLTPCTNARAALSGAGTLKEFRIKQNSISVDLSGGFFTNSDVYSDGSLISFGNALSQDAPNTVKIDAKPKAKCNTILGNNADGTFIADQNGSMTLMDFITTVKGWTVT